MKSLPINILLVDDEKDFAEMLSFRLEEKGHRVKLAFSGREALDALAENQTDVVIMDIRMPGLDGITTLKEVKARHPIVEVILLTGYGAVDTAVEGMKSGAFDYLVKPPDHEELLAKLEAAGKRKMEHEERIRLAEAKILTRRTGDI
jgi:DNA-binding NtrC family response regulator